MKTLSVKELVRLVEHHGLDRYLHDLIEYLRYDFSHWEEFTKVPRSSMKVPNGFIELMPIHGKTYHAYKYVTCYPDNPLSAEQTVVAVGQLSSVDTGIPYLISEMTVMTALRTAATTALVTDLMARKNSRTLAIIGTGAQSEFQVQALKIVRDITEIRYFDIDPKAMDKFENNLNNSSFKLIRCHNVQEAIEGADIITVCTACMGHAEVIKNHWVKPGVHINGLGGDCPGKTELELDILLRSRLVTEYLDQAIYEGELQRLNKDQVQENLFAELHEIANGNKKGRDNDNQVTLFDSVGMALEDYSVLRLTYELMKEYSIGSDNNLVPVLKNPKDLMSILL